MVKQKQKNTEDTIKQIIILFMFSSLYFIPVKI
jgi:hypothetical protein